jgi:cytochrome c biogenesis protein CcdA
MPCVFPILALKALHLAKSGGDEREARSDSLAYAAGAMVGTACAGRLLLAIRAGGSAAGWAFQLQDPRTIVFLMLLATAIALNLLGLFRLPVLAGGTRPGGGFATGALAAFVATPCAGPFLGAALGTALLLPAAGSVLVFAALGFGLAIPFLAIAFIPPLRRRLPAPGPWMVRLQRFLAIPMAATAVAARSGSSTARRETRRCWPESPPRRCLRWRWRGSAGCRGRAARSASVGSRPCGRDRGGGASFPIGRWRGAGAGRRRGLERARVAGHLAEGRPVFAISPPTGA